jgi:hypothetical protein
LGHDYFVDGKGSQSGLGPASLLLYFAITVTIQRLILQSRAQRIAGPPRNTGAPNASWQGSTRTRKLDFRHSGTARNKT